MTISTCRVTIHWFLIKISHNTESHFTAKVLHMCEKQIRQKKRILMQHALTQARARKHAYIKYFRCDHASLIHLDVH